MKNTIRFVLSNTFCPLFCLNCGKCGDILCDCCKKNMSLGYGKCLKCGKVLNGGFCCVCGLPFRFQFCLGERHGVLKELISEFKYNSNKVAGAKLVELIGGLVGFDKDTIIVPLPTIMKHVRERGFGQTE